MTTANSSDRPTLSWVVPMYRTGEFLEELSARIVGLSQSLDIDSELVLVDDACPENSAERARRVSCPISLHVVRLAHNGGQDVAVRAGLRLCQAPNAVVLDADLQDPPEAVSLLWPWLGKGYDAVFADRYGAYEARSRLLTSRLYRTAVRVVGELPSGAGLFVLMNQKIIHAIANTRTPRISILAAITAVDGHYTSIPIERAARRSGCSAYGSRRRLEKASWSLWQMFMAHRLNIRL